MSKLEKQRIHDELLFDLQRREVPVEDRIAILKQMNETDDIFLHEELVYGILDDLQGEVFGYAYLHSFEDVVKARLEILERELNRLTAHEPFYPPSLRRQKKISRTTRP